MPKKQFFSFSIRLLPAMFPDTSEPNLSFIHTRYLALYCTIIGYMIHHN